MIPRGIFLFLLPFWAAAQLPAFENDIGPIVEQIRKTKNEIVQENQKNGTEEKQLAFLAIWNFDNTILDGDSTDGLKDGEGQVVFKGLAQVAIEAGLSKKYPAQTGYAQYLKDYDALEATDEPKAYAYAAQMLAGARKTDVLNLSKNYFGSVLRRHFFQMSKNLIASLQNLGIRIYIVTASPRLFVQGSSSYLNIPIQNIYGMETEEKNGILGEKMVLPLTTRQGKVEKIGQIVQSIKEKEGQIKQVYVVMGFGNNNSNDIVFLKWIADQNWPAGSPLSLFSFHPPSLPKNFDSLILEQNQ